MINIIYNEDNLLTMQRMNDNLIHVDLTVTSPPYDNLRIYDNYTDFNCRAVAEALYSVTAPGGICVWVVGDQTINGSETGTSFRQALTFMDVGWNLHDTMIYRKRNYIPLSKHKRYEQAFEYMFVFSKGKPKTFNCIRIPCKTAGASNKGRTFQQTNNGILTPAHNNEPVQATKPLPNTWKLSTSNSRSGHPATFPERLPWLNIHTWTNPGDIVYDPFMGAGTTCRAARIKDRHFIGSEISEKYFNIAENNIFVQEVT